MALDREIRKRFTGDYTDWSIDYVYAHYDYSGNRKSGGWRNKEGLSESIIYFYKRQQPVIPEPKPVPPPPPVVEPVDEERMRIEAFIKHPTAFWLNPDWTKARETGEPFWMHDPAPVPQRYLPVEAKIRQVAELIADDPVDFNMIECRTLDQYLGDEMVIIMTMNDDIQLTRREYNQAQRLALRLTKEQRKHLLLSEVQMTEMAYSKLEAEMRSRNLVR